MPFIRVDGKLMDYANWEESKPRIRELMRKEYLKRKK